MHYFLYMWLHYDKFKQRSSSSILDRCSCVEKKPRLTTTQVRGIWARTRSVVRCTCYGSICGRLIEQYESEISQELSLKSPLEAEEALPEVVAAANATRDASGDGAAVHGAIDRSRSCMHVILHWSLIRFRRVEAAALLATRSYGTYWQSRQTATGIG